MHFCINKIEIEKFCSILMFFYSLLIKKAGYLFDFLRSTLLLTIVYLNISRNTSNRLHVIFLTLENYCK